MRLEKLSLIRNGQFQKVIVSNILINFIFEEVSIKHYASFK